MKMTDLFLAELEREAAGTRRTLERVPEGRNAWKPHEKSMPLGYLAALVARMPAWVAMMIRQDELDMAPKGGSKYKPQELETNRELLQSFDDSVLGARADALALSCRRPGRKRAAEARHAPRCRLQPLGPSPRTIDRLSPPQQRTRTGDLRTVGRRRTLRSMNLRPKISVTLSLGSPLYLLWPA